MRIHSPTVARLALVLAWLAPLACVGAGPGPARGAGGLLACAYVTEPSDDVATHQACASVSPSGVMRLQPRHLAVLRFDDAGLASVTVGKMTYYVARDGRTAPVARIDDKAAEFHDGLAPSPHAFGGRYRIGYIDPGLRLVIPARYDGGMQFDHGRAQVCRGCVVARDGDFAEMQGGLWGCIDTHGREVVPVTQPNPDQLDCAGSGD